MPRVEFEPTIPAFKRAKMVHASDRSVTVIGFRHWLKRKKKKKLRTSYKETNGRKWRTLESLACGRVTGRIPQPDLCGNLPDWNTDAKVHSAHPIECVLLATECSRDTASCLLPLFKFPGTIHNAVLPSHAIFIDSGFRGSFPPVTSARAWNWQLTSI
jgi:hypothetical protein